MRLKTNVHRKHPITFSIFSATFTFYPCCPPRTGVRKALLPTWGSGQFSALEDDGKQTVYFMFSPFVATLWHRHMEFLGQGSDPRPRWNLNNSGWILNPLWLADTSATAGTPKANSLDATNENSHSYNVQRAQEEKKNENIFITASWSLSPRDSACLSRMIPSSSSLLDMRVPVPCVLPPPSHTCFHVWICASFSPKKQPMSVTPHHPHFLPPRPLP